MCEIHVGVVGIEAPYGTGRFSLHKRRRTISKFIKKKQEEERMIGGTQVQLYIRVCTCAYAFTYIRTYTRMHAYITYIYIYMYAVIRI